MKGPAVILVVAVMLLSQIVPARAETEWHVTREAYGLRVGSVDLVTSANGRYTVVRQTRTTGRVAGGVQIRYEYDYEEETPECVGRFEEDAPVAFVTVDGFGEELAALHDPDRVVVTVNGERVGVPAETGLGEYIGWQNANRDGRYCVVFPILLTREGSRTEYAVRVQAVLDGERVAETAHITVILQNTHEYKAERALRIAALEGENVDAYLLGDRIYLDHPATAVGEARVRVTFADENGGSMDGIAWAGQTACAQPNQSAALYLEKECRLERSSAEYLLDQGADPLRHRKATFCVETEEALYRSPEYTLVQRQDVPAEDPRGLYFAQSECVLPVGGVFRPVVLSVATSEPVRTNAAGRLELLPGPGTDAQVLDVSDGTTVVATRPGTAYLTARYVLGERVYETGSMKLVVYERTQRMTVLCRTLNIRQRPSAAAPRTGVLRRGDAVQVVQVEDGWALTAQGQYVCAQYLGR